MKIEKNDIEKKINELFVEYKKEIDNPNKYEFYLFNKYDEIITLLSENENFTLKYLATCSDDFLYSILFDSNDSVEKILKSTKSKLISNFLIESLKSKSYNSNPDDIQSIISTCNKYL